MLVTPGSERVMRVSSYILVTGKNLVFWQSGRLQEMDGQGVSTVVAVNS